MFGRDFEMAVMTLLGIIVAVAVLVGIGIGLVMA